METTNIIDFARRDGMTDALTELLRTGAQELIATAVEAELASYLAQFADVRTDAGHAAVVRNGHHPERPFQTSIGPVSVRIPKVRSKDGTPVTFRSALVPPYVRRTKRSKGCLSRDGMLHMMFKLGQCAEQNWRKLRGFDYLAKVITGVRFKNGIEATNPDQIAA